MVKFWIEGVANVDLQVYNGLVSALLLEHLLDHPNAFIVTAHRFLFLIKFSNSDLEQSVLPDVLEALPL